MDENETLPGYPVASNDVISDNATVIINLSVLPILFLIGIFGNISTVIVFCQRKHKNASTVFIIGLAFADLSILLFRLIANIYSIGHQYFTEAIRYVRPTSFVWVNFSMIFQGCGHLLILTIILERFTAVWFPLHVRLIWTTRRAWLIVAAIFLLSLTDIMIIDSLIFSLNERIPEQGPMSIPADAMRYYNQQSPFLRKWSFIYRMLFNMAPLPIVLFFNITIIVGIRRNMFSKQKSMAKSQQRRYMEQRTTKMLVIISILYILLCGPFTIFVSLTIDNVIPLLPFYVNEIFQMLNVLNSVMNFLVYGLNDKNVRENYLKLWRIRKRQTFRFLQNT